ncbi:hypothetical protein Rctr197k_167 [Virus Rctr197k]|nr:hypothetical protein Rctr197k_167 [Virus Rctr197k]
MNEEQDWVFSSDRAWCVSEYVRRDEGEPIKVVIGPDWTETLQPIRIVNDDGLPLVVARGDKLYGDYEALKCTLEMAGSAECLEQEQGKLLHRLRTLCEKMLDELDSEEEPEESAQ